MMRKLFTYAFLAVVLLTSCVHQFPEEQDAFVVLKLNYDTELPIYKEVDWVSKASTSPDVYDARYVIKAFPKRKNSDKYYTSPSRTWVFTQDDVAALNYEVTLELDEGQYKFMAWTDFVLAGTDTDFFHNPKDFAEIREVTRYIGNNDMRDCFRGWTEIDVVRLGTQVEPVAGVIEMSRSIAKFSVYATDLADFITKAAKVREEAARVKGDTQTRVDPESINLSDYKVVFYYTGFKPNAYNMHNDRPCDSSTNNRFESTIVPVEEDPENQAFLGFDHCFSNGDDRETIVNLAIGIIDKTTGEEISLVKGIDVPLKRGQHTILRGRFMTQESYGGVAINPDFDGEFNIKI